MGEGTLLQQLLRLLNAGGLHTMDEAARSLGVSEALVEAMADNLARRGYLVALDGACGLSCSGCGATAGCGVAAPGASSSPARLMALTARGRGAAQAA